MHHDSLFKATFSRPEQAAALLRRVLDPALVAAIDWGSLRLLATCLVDGELSQRFVDLLFSATSDGEELLLYVLFEHRSYDDPITAFHLCG